MTTELKPCECDKTTSSIQYQRLWDGLSGSLWVVYCRYCQEFAPFKVVGRLDSYDEINENAAKAWNNLKGR